MKATNFLIVLSWNELAVRSTRAADRLCSLFPARRRSFFSAANIELSTGNHFVLRSGQVSGVVCLQRSGCQIADGCSISGRRIRKKFCIIYYMWGSLEENREFPGMNRSDKNVPVGSIFCASPVPHPISIYKSILSAEHVLLYTKIIKGEERWNLSPVHIGTEEMKRNGKFTWVNMRKSHLWQKMHF